MEYEEVLEDLASTRSSFNAGPRLSNGECSCDDVPDEELEAELDREEKRMNSMRHLENLSLFFQSQLCRALHDHYGTSDESQNSGRKSMKGITTIELANRSNQSRSKVLQFPKMSDIPSIKAIARLFLITNIAHEALLDNSPVTKRSEIYYRDVALFKSQKIVDALVDDIAASMDLARADLNIRASAKGTFCGSHLCLRLHNGDEVRGQDYEPALIPIAEDIVKFEVSECVSWVLIVEKDAVFQTLCSLGFTFNEPVLGPGILITGKGYPDIATRQLVKTLSDNLPLKTPIVILVDADPHGIDIALKYKYGSESLKHQNDGLAARRVHWIGVSTSDIFEMGIDRDALLPITIHDQKKAMSMLCSPHIPLTKSLRQELSRMLHTRRKAEIEIICAHPRRNLNRTHNEQNKRSNPLATYLAQKISKRLAVNALID